MIIGKMARFGGFPDLFDCSGLSLLSRQYVWSFCRQSGVISPWRNTANKPTQISLFRQFTDNFFSPGSHPFLCVKCLVLIVVYQHISLLHIFIFKKFEFVHHSYPILYLSIYIMCNIKTQIMFNGEVLTIFYVIV